MAQDLDITTATEEEGKEMEYMDVVFPEELLNKPQPPTPSISTSTSSSLNDNEGNTVSDDLFYRLQKENARLPPQVIIQSEL
jgi:hypothetical protein